MVAAVSGWAPAVSALMSLVMVTVQVMGCVASLSDPLHWFTLVVRSLEVVVNVPLEPPQGSKEHCRVTVTVELRLPPAIVLTMLTSQRIAVVAPAAPGA